MQQPSRGVFEESPGDKTSAVRVRARRIGVVGAGPAGLAVTRVFLENGFTDITVFERNSSVGGVWFYTPDSVCHYNVPQETIDKAVKFNYDKQSQQVNGYPTALYDDLRTNLPTDVMQFPGFHFSQDTDEFPLGPEVSKYVCSYAEAFDLQKCVQLNTEVTLAQYDCKERQWVCRVKSISSTNKGNDGLQEKVYLFDALIVCAGKASHPYIPDTPGLRKLSEQRPGCVMSAREYRRASDYAGMSVLVVGGAHSGSDIARQISFVGRSVHISMSRDNIADKTGSLDSDSATELSRVSIAGCNPENVPMVHPRLKQITSDSVIFADGSSIPIPDRIIYACGYLYAYPFIENNLVWSEQHLQNLSKQPSDLKPLTDGLVVNDLYQYMVYIHNPTLAILGVPQKIAPFSLYEYQAYFLTQVYQGILPLPSFQDMLEEWEQLVARYPGKELLTIGMRQVDYRDSMIELIERYGDGSSASKERLGYTGHDSEWAKRCAEVFSLRRNLLWSEWLRSTQ